MTTFDLAAILLALLAAAAWLNARTVRLPNGVTMLLVGIIGALGLTALRGGGGPVPDIVAAFGRLDFAHAVLGWLLAFLLFAGAMQVDLSELRRRRLSVLGLATAGVLASTALVGAGLWLAARALGLALAAPWALVFGALISPTDPVAVLATVRRGALPKGLKAILQGEALFNDGVGIVVFTALLAWASGLAPSPGHAALGAVVSAAGGLALGAAGGALVLGAMRAIDDFVAEVSLSLALAVGAYALAQTLGLSGPIAVVGAGLLVGSAGEGVASATTRFYLRSFWTLVDEILNALLFFLLGLQLFVVPLPGRDAGLIAVAVCLVLASRFVVVAPWGAILRREAGRGAGLILAWGGLHGALSLALALSLPAGPERPLLLALTWVVAAVSVTVQGLTFGPLTAALARRRAPGAQG